MNKKEKVQLSAKSKKPLKERMAHANSRGDFAAFFMLAPSVLLLLVTSVYPFLWIFRYVCYDYNGMTSYYTGSRNFTRMLTDGTFWNSVGHTFEYAILKIVFIIPLALIMAVLMNRRIKGSGLFRGIYFMTI